MRIKNEYIIINNGQKEIKLHNTILNKYLDKIIANQFATTANDRVSLLLENVYIRFDTPLVFDKTSNLDESDFNLKTYMYIFKDDVSSSKIILNYLYKFDETPSLVYDINLQESIEDMSPYVGKKITAIGFGGVDYIDNVEYNNIYACVDTSLYGISIETATEVFSVERRDILETDAFFYCPSKIVDGPIHLCNGQYEYFEGTQWEEFKLFSVLSSVGVGILPLNMDIEKTLLPYSSHITTANQTINIIDQFEIEYTSEGLFPATDLYPATNLYPERIVNELYPSHDIYPRNRYIPRRVSIPIHAIKI